MSRNAKAASKAPGRKAGGALIALFVLYVLLLIYSHRDSLIAFLGDSQDYLETSQLPLFSLGFFTRRPFTVPLVYKVLAQNPLAIVFAQLSLHAGCWFFLAWSAMRAMTSRFMKWGALAAILGFSLTVPVNLWNLSILSESIANSLTACLVGLVMLLLGDWPSDSKCESEEGALRCRCLLALALVVAFFWSFARDTNPYGLLIVAGLLLVLTSIRRVRGVASNRLFIGLAAALLGIAGLQSLLLSYSDRAPWNYAMSTVICNRILPVPEYRSFFEDAGMPAGPVIMKFAGKTNEYMENESLLKPDPSQVDRVFDQWVRERGFATYVSFLLHHPVTGLGWVWNLREELISPKPRRSWRPPPTVIFQLFQGRRVPLMWMWARGNFNGESGPTLLLTRILFPAWRGFWFVVLLLGVVSAGTFFLGRRAPVACLPLVLLLISFTQAFVIGLADCAEVDRHAIGVAILIRVAALLSLFNIADELLTAKALGGAVLNLKAFRKAGVWLSKGGI